MNKRTRKREQESTEALFEQRNAFKALLLTNPNYFGNLADSPFEPVLPIQRSTFYEELGCVGYHPQQAQLEAVVYVKQPWGYGTDICGRGTPEYVRFYTSADGGATWQDQGMTSFQAYNVPEGTDGARRLEYAASLKANLASRFCFFDPLLLMRAILSWSDPPPPNAPNWVPVWGDVQDATILREPRRFLPWHDLLEIGEIKLPPHLADVLDLETPVKAKVQNLDAVQLARLYAQQDVPAHRFAFKEIAGFVSAQTSLSAAAFTELLGGIKLDPGIMDLLFPKEDGNTSYEELTCIGLDPNQPNTLVGIIQVKKPSGYSGGPCTSGSREYVTFWGDFDGNGTFETCLGTADVKVYDLPDMPGDGIFYAVRLPVDLSPYTKSCLRGPVVVRIRAILSWNVPAPCANPNHVPTWGNREETLIHIAPGMSAPAGRIAILGGIPVAHIDNTSGLTMASAVFATNNLAPDSLGRPCPFGGRVTVQGAPLLGHSYKVEVTPLDSSGSPVGAPTPVATDLVLTRADGTTYVHTANTVSYRFTYVDFSQNINGVLAQWDSTGDARWQVKLSTYDGAGTLVGIDTHLIQLDNTAPEASITIVTGAGDCGKFGSGTVLSGKFVARDEYLGHYTLGVDPDVNPPGVGVPMPSFGQSNTVGAPGDNWSLNTTGMKPCGYVLRVVAVDRAIVNSQSVGHYAADSAGFCLEG
jgi:hypothetical protein